MNKQEQKIMLLVTYGFLCFTLGLFCLMVIYNFDIIKIKQTYIIDESLQMLTEYDLYFNLFNDDVYSSGFYSAKGYFCVATAGRTPIEVAETTFHELAHYYIHYDEEHFINEWVQKREESKIIEGLLKKLVVSE